MRAEGRTRLEHVLLTWLPLSVSTATGSRHAGRDRSAAKPVNSSAQKILEAAFEMHRVAGWRKKRARLTPCGRAPSFSYSLWLSFTFNRKKQTLYLWLKKQVESKDSIRRVASTL